MAERTRYVNTGSTSGGTGTTNATSGSSRAYASMSLAEAGEQADLDAAGDWLHLLCDGAGGADTTACIIDGFTTSATDYILVEGNPDVSTGRHSGIWDTSKYLLHTTNANPLTIRDQFVKINGIQIQVTETGTTNPRIAVLIDTLAAGAIIDIVACLIREGSGTTGGGLFGIRLNDADGILHLVNTILIGFRMGSARGLDIQSSGGTAFVYHCGGYNCDLAFRGSLSESAPIRRMTIKNTWAMSCTDGFELAAGSWGSGTGYNASDISSDAPGTSPRTGNITFVDTGGFDFHLSSSDTVAKGYGVDLSADSEYPMTVDIDRTAIASWSGFNIGPDQFETVISAMLDAYWPRKRGPSPRGPFSIQRFSRHTGRRGLLVGLVSAYYQTISVAVPLTTSVGVLVARNQSLSASTSLSASVSNSVAHIVGLTAATALVVLVSLLSGHFLTLAASVGVAALMAYTAQFFRSLSASTSAIGSIAPMLSQAQTITAAVSVLGLLSLMTINITYQTMVAVVALSAGIAMLMAYYRTLASSVAASGAIALALSFLRGLSASVTAIPTVSRSASLFISLSSSTILTPSMAIAKTIRQTLSAATGILAYLVSLLIPGGTTGPQEVVLSGSGWAPFEIVLQSERGWA